MGWSMNDLRSRHRTLTPVPTKGPRTGEIVSTSPKIKNRGGNPLFESSRPVAVPDEEAEVAEPVGEEDPLTFQVSRDLRSMPVTASTEDDEAEADDVDPGEEPTAEVRGERPRSKAPSSRPTKRREMFETDDAEDDKFPWHHQFDDDEPEELQAKSPLLSRAFRSSVG